MARKSGASSTRQTRTTVTARRPRTSKKAEPASQAPSQEQISARAYEIYCERMRTGQPGDQAGDWAAAEAELKSAAGR